MNNTSNQHFYLDNASTTQIDPDVITAMQPHLQHLYGNPSTSHQLGNLSKVAIEEARNTIRNILNANQGDIFFTSGGTEGNNLLLQGLIHANHIEHVITSKIEHKSVLAPLEHLAKKGVIHLHFVTLDNKAQIDIDNLKKLLQQHNKNTLVSLMHGNNEIGNLTNITHIATLCEQHKALFHTDTVQTLAHYNLDLTQISISACTGSAHKFHGPKGIGFIYIRHGIPITPLFHGGNQEKTIRPGTENTPYIIGMAKALSIAHQERTTHYNHLHNIKTRCIKELQQAIPNIIFQGNCQENTSLPNIINIGIPTKTHQDTLLLHLDTLGIQASSGSACMSGTNLRSHVLEALNVNPNYTTIRLSFSKYNKIQEVPLWTKKIATLIGRYFYTFN